MSINLSRKYSFFNIGSNILLNNNILIKIFTSLDFCPSLATPLPEEFELQGFLALRPSFR